MNNQQNVTETVQTMTTAALAATSQTPFKTAFKITMGIGLANLSLFLLGITGCLVLVGSFMLVMKNAF